MKSRFEYRSYEIVGQDQRYTAKSLDGDSFSMISNHLIRLLRAVDHFWDTLENTTATERIAMKPWMAVWMKNPVDHIDLDLAIEGTEDLYQAIVSPCRLIDFPGRTFLEDLLLKPEKQPALAKAAG